MLSAGNHSYFWSKQNRLLRAGFVYDAFETATRLSWLSEQRTRSFASPPLDGFAFIALRFQMRKKSYW